jgi:isopenicillin-N N-acyltransferase-like protein
VRSSYPHVRVEGGPRERGNQYGEQARERIQLSIEAYRDVFAHYAGWSWPRVTAEARRYEEPIDSLDPKYLGEIRGIAEGASVPYEDVLAINVRTEVMFAAKARTALGECSSFAVQPSACVEGRTLIGQNWDWLLHSFETVLVLEARQESGPDFVTVVEAGLLAKSGMNSSGIGLVTNALVTADDRGDPGVPYHVALRAILDCETLSDAVAVLQRRPRASSANYLIAHEDGIAVDVEAAPGDFSRLHLIFPENGVLLHTNHIRSTAFQGTDVSIWLIPDSPVRLDRLRSLVEAERGSLSLETFQRVLGDHANYPSALCCHPDPRVHELERGASVTSVLMELDSRRMWIADGSPCRTPYRELDYASFLAKPSPLRQHDLVG